MLLKNYLARTCLFPFKILATAPNNVSCQHGIQVLLIIASMSHSHFQDVKKMHKFFHDFLIPLKHQIWSLHHIWWPCPIFAGLPKSFHPIVLL